MKLINIILLGITCYIVEITLFNLLALKGTKPDLMLLLTVFISLSLPAPRAILAGYTIGLIKDLGSSAGLGSHGLLFMLISLGISELRGIVFKESLFVQFWIVLISSLFAELIPGGYFMIKLPGLKLETFLITLIVSTFYTTLLWIPIFAVYKILLQPKNL
jgi:rod shape-determining protein MreD